MKVKVGDMVKVIAGADKGKTGKVIKTLKTESKVVVEGVHIVKKHSKPTSMNDKGGIFEIEAPIHVSNVKVIDDSPSFLIDVISAFASAVNPVPEAAISIFTVSPI